MEILFYKLVQTKHLFNLFKIGNSVGYQLFFTKQDTSKMPWLYLAWISKYLSLWLFLLLIACFSLSLGVVAAYFQAEYWWRWVLPNLVLSCFLTFCFVRFQQKGNQIYYQFMQAVEQRHKAEKPTHISPEHSQVLQRYLFKIQSTWFKIATLLILLPLLVLAVHHYQTLAQKTRLSSQPSQALQKLILIKKAQIKQWQEHLKKTQVLIKTAQKEYVKSHTQLQQAEAAIRYQLNTLMQSQAHQHTLQTFAQSLNTAANVAEKETRIKSNPQILAQVQGALESQLALKDQDESKAAQLLSQEGKLYETLQALLTKQAYSLSKAQKALAQERNQKKILEEKTAKAKQHLQLLTQSEDQYCHQKQRFEQDLQVLQKRYLYMKAKEKHSQSLHFTKF